jgi:hypothetical protein
MEECDLDLHIISTSHCNYFETSYRHLWTLYMVDLGTSDMRNLTLFIALHGKLTLLVALHEKLTLLVALHEKLNAFCSSTWETYASCGST